MSKNTLCGSFKFTKFGSGYPRIHNVVGCDGCEICKNKEDTVLSSCASHFNKIHQHLLVPHLQSKDNDGYNYEFTGDPLLFKVIDLPNNQGLLVEEECILKKNEISELNKVFNFPSNFQVNVAPFGTPEGISVSLTVKNNDTDLLICRKANQR
ncbi:hypothetical protein ACTFIW_000983 [Dictyostelium discoideum]